MTPDQLKACLDPFRTATATFESDGVRAALKTVFSNDASISLCHPFGDMTGGDALIDAALGPLHAAMPDLERRDMIVMAGTTPEGEDWVGTMGNYMGTFLRPFLGIPPTGHLAHMRYHEFFRIEDGQLPEMQAIWRERIVPQRLVLCES